jgi:hypothetical protein
MFRLLLVLLSSVTLGACELVGDVFQAGLVVGIIVVLLVVAIIGWVIRRLRR